MELRLQRILAAAGLASRRRAEEWIRQGRVQVNGRIARLGERADPGRDEVRVDGRCISAQPLRYWLLHKPRGVLSTTRDPRGQRAGLRIVLDLLPARARSARLYPVGRLDKDSEGLLLLTNDGDAAQALLHPSLGAEKEYRVTVRGRFGAAVARRLAAGPLLDDGPMAPCKVGLRSFDAEMHSTTFALTLREGRKRQIRRALQQLGYPVLHLLRTRMGPLKLQALPCGAARELTAAERRRLQNHARRAQRHSPRRNGPAPKSRRSPAAPAPERPPTAAPTA